MALRGRSPDAVLERVARTLSDGAIIMLHDAAEHDDYEPAAVRALPRLVALLDERGLTSVGLDALLPATEGQAYARQPGRAHRSSPSGAKSPALRRSQT